MATETIEVVRDRAGRISGIERPVTEPANVHVQVDVADALDQVRADAFAAGEAAGYKAAAEASAVVGASLRTELEEARAAVEAVGSSIGPIAQAAADAVHLLGQQAIAQPVADAVWDIAMRWADEEVKATASAFFAAGRYFEREYPDAANPYLHITRKELDGEHER